MSRLLLVDDDPGLLKLLSLRLGSYGHAVDTATSGREALRRIETDRPDLVISDLRMDDMDGMELLEHIARNIPGLPVIMLTAHGTIPDAVRATRHGAFGFLTKPVNRDELLALVEQALRDHGSMEDDWRADIITRNGRMEDLLGQARMVADTDAAVMITGESGTGKELLARAIHHAGSRTEQPFMAINCGAIPPDLLESELFGHEKGAFTGATQSRDGLFMAADGGTVFLDEIGDMPIALQVKLLRVLQERKVRRIGSSRDTPIDVRIISATHRDIDAAMASGDFREDLFYRLNVVHLHIPPLRDRPEDIPLLARHLLQRHQDNSRNGGKSNRPQRRFSEDALELLVTAEWPGNVRQLGNFVERCLALTPGQVIDAAHARRQLDDMDSGFRPLAEAQEQFTRDYLVQLLRITTGNVSRAARLAGRNRTEFYRLLQRHSLDPATFKPQD